MDEEDWWIAFTDRRGVGPKLYMKMYWDLTAAMVARNVANRLGVNQEEVDIVTEADGRPVAGNTMVCRPLQPLRRSNHRRTNPYEYVVRRAE